MTDAEQNKTRFLSLLRGNVHRDGLEDLIEYLNTSDFFTAPASTRFHGAYEGGLCEHSLNVYENIIKLRDTFLPEYNTDENNETLTLVALLHDVCKTGCYVPSQKNVKAKNPDGTFIYVNGKPQWDIVWGYEWNEQLPLGHGEKSCLIIQRYIKLTDEELLAIRWHMGGYDSAFRGGDVSLNRAQELYPVVTLIQTADMIDADITTEKENTENGEVKE